MRASASAPALHDAGSKHVDGRARRGSVGLAGAPTAGHARRGSIGVPGASEGEGRRQSVVTGVDDPSGALRAAAKIGTRRKSVVEDSGALAAARQLGEERGVGTARTFGTFSRGGRYGKGGWGAEAVAAEPLRVLDALFQLKAPVTDEFLRRSSGTSPSSSSPRSSSATPRSRASRASASC